MGPKKKGKKAGKVQPPPPPPVDPNEIVTELQRQVFEIQLSDIELKLSRISTREEYLKSETTTLEEKLEEFKREKGAIIAEHEQLLAIKEEEKIQKREEMVRLSNEIKIGIENHKKHLQELEERYNKMVEELTSQLEELEEEVRVLDDYKQNRHLYANALEDLEKQIEEDEMQHQRNLFNIERKWEMAKVRVKKELESRLLQLSIEFQQISQKRIGAPCHRVTQENKAIENEIRLMREEIAEYEEKYHKSKHNLVVLKSHTGRIEEEKDKEIARTAILKVLMKELLQDRLRLLEKLKEFMAIDAENKSLLKKLKSVCSEIERKLEQTEEVMKKIEDKIEAINSMKEITNHLKKNSRRLQVLSRNALKVAEEAMAVRLIPMGGMEEEKFMNSEAKIRLFKRRRDVVFQKKGRILQYLFEFLSKAQLSDEDKKILQGSTESLNIEDINFALLYGKVEPDLKEVQAAVEEEEGPEALGSDVSLPRSISEVQIKKVASETESLEGEYEGEFEEDEEGDEREDEAEPAKATEGAEGKDAAEEENTASVGSGQH